MNETSEKRDQLADTIMRIIQADEYYVGATRNVTTEEYHVTLKAGADEIEMTPSGALQLAAILKDNVGDDYGLTAMAYACHGEA